jgi:uroporphyrinogen decarboxylase
MIKNDLVLRAARRERTERTPVWLMRQAGRCDPEYRRIRERVDLPLEEMFRQPDVAAEISLLPRRLGVDAIIFFQDILTPLAPMGAQFVFRPGPQLQSTVRTPSDVEGLRDYDVAGELNFVTETLRLVRNSLAGSLPVLGFAGAPFTLACFLIEGRSPGRTSETTRAMMRADPVTFHRLLDRLTDLTVDYLNFQVEAGADAVQLFESTADAVSLNEYREFAHPYHVRIFSELAGRVPTILFVKEQPFVELMAASGADVLSVGTCVDLAAAKHRFGDRVAFQGNVDSHLLATGSPDEIDAAVRACVLAGGHEGHILNLSQGVLKETSIQNVCRLIDTCKSTAVLPDPAAASAR